MPAGTAVSEGVDMSSKGQSPMSKRMAVARERGARLGRPISIAEVTPEMRKLIADLYENDGLSQRKIAAYMMAKGIKTPTGNKIWHHSTVQSILRAVALDKKAEEQWIKRGLNAADRSARDVRIWAVNHSEKIQRLPEATKQLKVTVDNLAAIAEGMNDQFSQANRLIKQVEDDQPANDLNTHQLVAVAHRAQKQVEVVEEEAQAVQNKAQAAEEAITAVQNEAAAAEEAITAAEKEAQAAEEAITAAEKEAEAARYEAQAVQNEATAAEEEAQAAEEERQAAKLYLDNAVTTVTESSLNTVPSAGRQERAKATRMLASDVKKVAARIGLAADNTQMAAVRAEIAAVRAHVSHGKARLAADKAKMAHGKARLAADKAKMAYGKARLTADKAKMAHGKARLTADKAQLAADKVELAKDKAQMAGDSYRLATDLVNRATQVDRLGGMAHDMVDQLAGWLGDLAEVALKNAKESHGTLDSIETINFSSLLAGTDGEAS